jgi:hypothetical protein
MNEMWTGDVNTDEKDSDRLTRIGQAVNDGEYLLRGVMWDIYAKVNSA